MADRDPVDYAWNLRLTTAMQESYTSLDTVKDALLGLSEDDPSKNRARMLRRMVAAIDDLMTEIEEMC